MPRRGMCIDGGMHARAEGECACSMQEAEPRTVSGFSVREPQIAEDRRLRNGTSERCGCKMFHTMTYYVGALCRVCACVPAPGPSIG